MSKKEIVLIAGILLVLFFVFQPMLQSIVSVSQVTYNKTGSMWVANVVVNSSDSITFKKENLIADLGNGQKIKAQSDIRVDLLPLNPQCNYALTPRTFNLTLLGLPYSNITYYSLGNEKLSVPYTAKVFKTNALGTTQLYPDGSTTFFGVQIPKTIDATSGETTLTFTDKSSGAKVYIQNLGALRGAYDCPDSSNAILVPNIKDGKIESYKLVNESDWKNKMNNLNNNPIITLISVFLQTNPVGTPSQFTSYKADVSKSNLLVELTPKDYKANITVSIESKFADSVIYTPSAGKPVILSYTASKGTNLTQTENTTYSVQVKNEGTLDVFEFFISSREGLLSFNRATTSVTFNANETKTISFVGQGLIHGTDEICVKVASTSIFSTTDSKCLTQNVIKKEGVPEPTPAPVCGDGFCDSSKGENFNSCITDCPVPTPEPTGCAKGYHLTVKDEPVWWSLGLLKNTITSCEQDFPIEIALIIFGAVAVILGFLVLRRQ